MWTVLQQLGYKDCYHMLNLFTNPPDVDMWMEATNAQFYGKGKEFGRPEWDRLLGNCQVGNLMQTAPRLHMVLICSVGGLRSTLRSIRR